jgi:hypothetical protein
MRWLHIYLSMFSLAVVLFFSVTGLTLNHPDWFFANAQRTSRSEGKLDLSWLRRDPVPPGGEAEASGGDLSSQVDKLRVVEHFRSAHGVRGALTDFKADEYECSVTFKGPGYDADAFIDRATGKYTLTQTSHGLVAVLNDLHNGRDSGPAWSFVIDASAVLMTVVSLTGLVLLFYLKLRRRPGVVVGLIGAVVALAVVWFGVP